ncbi:hypothetical protein [Adhaeribacter rhizoryzae]|uniref:Uncharacterized protein n=1 Tax=Adhaeribacter rhizoryzae TaxID=2607907 RepID=A0A5M6DNS9_9BACT|nr:hypothetical protein [Adhaeribacter rhizoryzae]KAA5547902.1 hypothetical protein F0145_08165 [Adhaeribacter rhizoryzae]
MRQILLLFALFLFNVNLTLAQDSAATQTAPNTATENLNRLLHERAQMIKDYEYYNAQNSNFWGKKSKKDLLNIIDVLKKVINKDSEIIREINLVNLRKQAEIKAARAQAENQKKQIEFRSIDDKRVVSDNLYALKTQIQNMENKEKVKQRQINALEESLTISKETIQKLEQLIAVSVVAILGLAIFAFTRTNKSKRKKI